MPRRAGRPAAPTGLACQSLADRVGGGCGVPFAFRLLSGYRPGRLAPGNTGLLLVAGEVLRLGGDPFAQSLHWPTD